MCVFVLCVYSCLSVRACAFVSECVGVCTHALAVLEVLERVPALCEYACASVFFYVSVCLVCVSRCHVYATHRPEAV